MDEMIGVTADENAMLWAAIVGPLRPVTPLDHQRAVNLAARRLLQRFPSPRPWRPRRLGRVTFVLSPAGWTYLKTDRQRAGRAPTR